MCIKVLRVLYIWINCTLSQWICSEIHCRMPGMQLHLYTWQQSFCLQQHSVRIQTDWFSHHGLLWRCASQSREPVLFFCSWLLTHIHVCCLHQNTLFSQCTVMSRARKDEGLPQMSAYGKSAKSVCLYLNVWLQAAPGYIGLLFWNLICLESFH